ncbi:acyloxyacyl hydrolase [Sphingobacterium sp. DK4209]|uniref:Acyloxyacyl hydrolase n=1 Tax=Sphingobacterium zhuxiongii TaxID=2662364 RepID=A0A5Q0QE67_9SPHI|nr:MULTISPECIES: acyloxyacyl hydrolase [unclassified Sphingobacterium]MVZ66523.1 acyloxyacyl hydrolase [Sphingobacterium sp. DK4209]QGA27823.1 acyloxyacyl hydrolase [Sphingobacterium sp. dk4302]
MSNGDSTRIPFTKFSHHFSAEVRSAYVFPTSPFYKSEIANDALTKQAIAGHVRYSFALPKGSLGNQIFSKTQQGIGVAVFSFGNDRELGTPIASYLFQNAEILRLSKLSSLHYEWNFGLSSGWRPYNPVSNPMNMVMGSKVNAYINLGLFFKWRLNKQWNMMTGADFTHFSNGNTEYPNAGLNMIGAKLGLAYNLTEHRPKEGEIVETALVPSFPRHVSYDFVLFGSWRRKGIEFGNTQVASPDKYPVVGAYFAPMYNLGYRMRAGVSIDMLYDGSGNVYTEDYIVGTEQPFYKPHWKEQLALGLSGRADFTMPIFTISVGIGTHILHRGGDFSGTYQSLALKTKVTRSTFLHIGYSIKDFRDPNYLMLGIGYRFNNKTPLLVNF